MVAGVGFEPNNELFSFLNLRYKEKNIHLYNFALKKEISEGKLKITQRDSLSSLLETNTGFSIYKDDKLDILKTLYTEHVEIIK